MKRSVKVVFAVVLLLALMAVSFYLGNSTDNMITGDLALAIIQNLKLLLVFGVLLILAILANTLMGAAAGRAKNLYDESILTEGLNRNFKIFFAVLLLAIVISSAPPIFEYYGIDIGGEKLSVGLIVIGMASITSKYTWGAIKKLLEIMRIPVSKQVQHEDQTSH